MPEEILLTKEGYEKLVNERDELVSVKRKEISEKLKEAREFGDLSENAEYDAAKEEQAEVEERIMKLDQMLRNAKIIDDGRISTKAVNVGVKVEIKKIDDKSKKEYVIVGSTEADPFATPARISNESAVGKALIGRKVGEKIEIQVPAGILRYEITAIKTFKSGDKKKSTK